MKKGKLIVIEGTDGSGKATQAKVLIARLRAEGRAVTALSFPRYGTPEAKGVEEYLAGKFGPPDKVDAASASKFFAADRLGAAPEICTALERGDTVILDRYTPSNAGHQGGKMKNAKEREAFIEWLYRYEYEEQKIPKPDLVVILRVPVEVSLHLIESRGRPKDGHETDANHLRNAEATYVWLAQRFPDDHKLVECVEGGKMLPPEVISERVYATVKPLL